MFTVCLTVWIFRKSYAIVQSGNRHLRLKALMTPVEAGADIPIAMTSGGQKSIEIEIEEVEVEDEEAL